MFRPPPTPPVGGGIDTLPPVCGASAYKSNHPPPTGGDRGGHSKWLLYHLIFCMLLNAGLEPRAPTFGKRKSSQLIILLSPKF